MFVEHCQHCRFNNKELDNFVFNDKGLDMFVFNDKGLDMFVFNDNSDNDWQYYYWYSWEHLAMLLILLSNIVEHCRFNNKGLDIFVFNNKELDIFVFNNKGLDIFVFNDNSDNGRQYY